MKQVEIEKHLGAQLSVPSLPKVVERIRDLLGGPEASMVEVGRAVAQDPPLTARLLRSVNSPHYGLAEPILSPEHAASVAGFRGLENLLLRAPVFSGPISLGLGRFDVRTLWRHSILTARVAAELTRVAAGANELEPADMHVCGLLADIGHFVMFDRMGEDWVDVYERAEAEDVGIDVLEREVFGFTHNDLGAMMAKRWALPEAVVRATRFHDNENGLAELDVLPAIVLVADRIVHCIERGSWKSFQDRTPAACLERLDVEPTELEALGARAAETKIVL